VELPEWAAEALETLTPDVRAAVGFGDHDTRR
jgi:hypothetical protein